MKRRIAVLFPKFMGGGAEAVCAWILEALKEEYTLTLFTLNLNDLSELNRLYGTNISEGEIQVIRLIPRPLTSFGRFFLNTIGPAHFTRKKLVVNRFKRIQEEFDLAISTYNEAELGGRAIQYIHWINASKKKGFAFSEKALKYNLTLTNSENTARHIKKHFGVQPLVVYPPVVSDFPFIPWDKKGEGFVCIGRLNSEKSPHIAINILRKVRASGHDVHLHIIGSGGDSKYLRYLEVLRKQNNSWVFIEKNINHEKFVSLVARHKYGIHWKKEPFGIVVAEMMKAGCIPFVRNAGGQLEIIGKENALMFGNIDEAVDRVVSVLSSKEEQLRIRDSLSRRVDMFSVERFKNEVLDIVRDFLKGKAL